MYSSRRKPSSLPQPFDECTSIGDAVHVSVDDAPVAIVQMLLPKVLQQLEVAALRTAIYGAPLFPICQPTSSACGLHTPFSLKLM